MSEKPEESMRAGKYQILPPLNSEDYNSLKEDIKTRGVQVPVVFDEDGNILDGYTRHQILKELGITDFPITIKPGLNDEEKKQYALSLNLKRRHLTKEEREALIMELRKQGLSTRKISKVIHIARDTVMKNLKKQKDIYQVVRNVPPAYILGSDGKKYPAIHTHSSQTTKALKVASAISSGGQKADEVSDKLSTGELTVNRAEKLLTPEQGDTKIKPAPAKEIIDVRTLFHMPNVEFLKDVTEKIRTMQWSKPVEDFIIAYLIPVLRAKSSRLRDIFKEGPYGDIAKLRFENTTLHNNTVDLSRALAEKNKELEALRKQPHLETTKKDCRRDCEKSREWARLEFAKSLQVDAEECIKTLEIIEMMEKFNDNGDARVALIEVADRTLKRILSSVDWGKKAGLIDEGYYKHKKVISPLVKKLVNKSKGGGLHEIHEAAQGVIQLNN